ncbi:MAG: hypothetical protein KTR31_38035 [Myxococcales bacterium]|nr:hypothetical protein [Myxococcales bacterium]
MSNDPLMRAVLMGTEAAGLPEASSAPARLLARAPQERPEGWQLLLRAGMESIHQRAATVAAEADSLSTPAAAADERPPCSAAAARSLLQIVSRHGGLVPWAVQQLQQAGLRVPAVVVPALLDSRHRAEVAAVLGTVAGWLAAMNAEWRDAATGIELPADAEVRFEEGTVKERVAILRALRGTAPGQARDWVAAALPGERADAREALVRALDVGLCADDESMLQQVVTTDRAAGVRSAARWLLLRLPASAESEAAMQRALEVLHVHGARVEIRAPARFAGAPQQAGVAQTPPPRLGKRAWWAIQILERVPPGALARAVGRAPRALLAALGSEPELAYAWTRALPRWPDAAVARALWPWWQERESRPGWIHSDVEELPSHLDEGDAVAFGIARLRHLEAPDPGLLRAVGHPWPDELAEAWLRWMSHHSLAAHDDRTGAALLAGAAGLPQPLVDRALKAVAARPLESDGAQRQEWRAKRLRMDLDMLAEALDARAQFERHLREQESP